MEKEQVSKWKALQGDKKDKAMSFYTIGLWIVLILSLLNGFLIGASATSAIHQIYGGISFIIAALMFCTLAIRAKISDMENVINK
jgi:hypothetical protein